MAIGTRAREREVESVLRQLLNRIRRLERPTSIHLGGIGGGIGGQGFTLTVNQAGDLVAISDSGTTTIIANQ